MDHRPFSFYNFLGGGGGGTGATGTLAGLEGRARTASGTGGAKGAPYARIDLVPRGVRATRTLGLPSIFSKPSVSTPIFPFISSIFS
jgi:hypothetical protein